jgi:hypothetical protein
MGGRGREEGGMGAFNTLSRDEGEGVRQIVYNITRSSINDFQ